MSLFLCTLALKKSQQEHSNTLGYKIIRFYLKNIDIFPPWKFAIIIWSEGLERPVHLLLLASKWSLMKRIASFRAHCSHLRSYFFFDDCIIEIYQKNVRKRVFCKKITRTMKQVFLLKAIKHRMNYWSCANWSKYSRAAFFYLQDFSISKNVQFDLCTVFLKSNFQGSLEWFWG